MQFGIDSIFDGTYQSFIKSAADSTFNLEEVTSSTVSQVHELNLKATEAIQKLEGQRDGYTKKHRDELRKSLNKTLVDLEELQQKCRQQKQNWSRLQLRADSMLMYKDQVEKEAKQLLMLDLGDALSQSKESKATLKSLKKDIEDAQNAAKELSKEVKSSKDSAEKWLNRVRLGGCGGGVAGIVGAVGVSAAAAATAASGGIALPIIAGSLGVTSIIATTVSYHQSHQLERLMDEFAGVHERLEITKDKLYTFHYSMGKSLKGVEDMLKSMKEARGHLQRVELMRKMEASSSEDSDSSKETEEPENPSGCKDKKKDKKKDEKKGKKKDKKSRSQQQQQQQAASGGSPTRVVPYTAIHHGTKPQ